MPSLKSFTVAASALLTLLFLLPAMQASAQHPKYRQAISNLATAREYLQKDTRPDFLVARGQALEEITKAIDELKKVVIDDGQNPSKRPPAQTNWDTSFPLHSTIKLMDEARENIQNSPDTLQNRDLAARCFRHLDNARDILHPFL